MNWKLNLIVLGVGLAPALGTGADPTADERRVAVARHAAPPASSPSPPVAVPVPALAEEGLDVTVPSVPPIEPEPVVLTRTPAAARSNDARAAPAGPPPGVTRKVVQAGPAEPWTPGGARPPRRLTKKERAALQLSNEWAGADERPARGEAGLVVYTFGASLPSVICSPLYVCDVTLQPGEVVYETHLGDAVRWKLDRGIGGPGGNTPHVLVKPSQPDLETSLVVITDRRTYVLRLVAHPQEWMPRVAFSYPEDGRQIWNAVQRANEEHRKATTLPDGQNVADLDFGFTLKGSAAWRPLRVYTDGVKTYIQFPAVMRHDEAPALVALTRGDKEQLVNYRKHGDRYIVDKVLTHALLVAGVGRHQEKVEIVRGEERKDARAELVGMRR